MKLITIGDSITHGQFTDINDSFPNSLAKPYGQYIAEYLNVDSFTNYGVNGTPFSKTSSVNGDISFEQISNTYSSADIVLFMGGTNDFGTNVKLNDFEAAVKKTFSEFKRKYENSKVIIITPLHRFDEAKNEIGLSLFDYAEIIRKYAETFSFMCINGFDFFVNPTLEEHRKLYSKDGVHLNNEAHKLLAEFIISKNLFNKKIFNFEFNNHKATVIVPDNKNGKWVWKSEFFYAFDKLEQRLCDDGYTRVYYSISDMYGCPKSIELMHDFYIELLSKFNLEKKCIMIGYSRGGLYAFNYAIKYPECVEKMYLDSPVLDLRTWPKKENDLELYNQVLNVYGFKNEEEYLNYSFYPVNQLENYFKLGIPTLLVCAHDDSLVPHELNSKKMIDYALKNNINNFYYYVKVGNAKEGGEHHPHSFGNNILPLMYGCEAPQTFKVYSNVYKDTSLSNLKTVLSDENIIKWFFLNDNRHIKPISNLDLDKDNKIVFKKDSTFHYYEEDLTKVEDIYLSNTDSYEHCPRCKKHVFIKIDNEKDVVIDGNGSSIIFHGLATFFLFNNCENVTLKNFKFDFYNPTMSEMTVINKVKDKFYVRVNEDCLFNVVGNNIIFHSEMSQNGEYYWSYDYRDYLNLCMFKEKETGYTRTQIRNDDCRFPCAPKFKTIKLIDNNLLEVELENKDDYFQIDSTVEIRSTIRDELAGAFNNCKNVTLENVTFNCIHGFGVLSQCSENINIINNTFTSSHHRIICSNADFLHFSCCRGPIVIKNNYLKEGHDDYINVHGVHTKITKIIDEKTVLATFMHPATYGFIPYKINDQIGFVRQADLEIESYNYISDINLFDLNALKITFKNNIDDSILNTCIEDIDTSPDVLIEGNDFNPTIGRGILMTTRGKVDIINNQFNGLALPVLLVANDCNFWYESGRTNYINFENNIVKDCSYNCFDKEMESVINICPEVMDKNHKIFIHKKIIIKNNDFSTHLPYFPLFISFCEDFELIDNQFNKEYRINKVCSNVKDINNKIIKNK